VISIVVNGVSRQFPQPLTYAELLVELDLGGRRVALERNGEIVPRSRFAEQTITDGDQLEIVAAVGGG
jgi:sulfur carrier protein